MKCILAAPYTGKSWLARQQPFLYVDVEDTIHFDDQLSYQWPDEVSEPRILLSADTRIVSNCSVRIIGVWVTSVDTLTQRCLSRNLEGSHRYIIPVERALHKRKSLLHLANVNGWPILHLTD